MSRPTSQIPETEALSILLPAYDFEKLIATGRTSLVYKARQRSLDRNVAIKILPQKSIREATVRHAFLSHAKAMARLTHPNLIRVFDSGEADGMLFIVMEYVHGHSLAHSTAGDAIDPQQAVEIVHAACGGLDFARENGVDLQGIDSSKILLNQECQPKIAAFGLSDHVAIESSNDGLLTNAHTAVTCLDRSIVYSVGVMLCELLTGSGIEHFQSGASRINNPRLAQIVKKAIGSPEGSTYGDIGSLKDELEAWLKAASSRLLTGSASKPTARNHSPQPAVKKTYQKPAPRPSTWPNVGKCAAIALLLCVIHFFWGAYQANKESIAKLHETDKTEKPVVKIIEVQETHRT